MPRVSNAQKQRIDACERARANNSKNNSNVSFNDALIGTQLEMSESSDNTPENLFYHHESIEDTDLTPDLTPDFDMDQTPDNLETDSNDSKDSDFSPLSEKLMVIPDTFLALLMQFVVCSACQTKGKITPNVINASGFQNEIMFLCKCKHSFSMQTFPDTNINEVLIRNTVANAIPKQAFQRWLQVGNFGANVEGKEIGINLFTRQSRSIYEQQNQEIIEGAKRIHQSEIKQLREINKPIKVSTDMCYAKRGYHSPAGHAAFICNKKVIDAETVKRSNKKSESAYGDITDKSANQLEAYAITKMLKHLIPVVGSLIEQIDLDQDAALHKVIENLKWTAEDVDVINKWTGKKEISEDMIGKSVWNGKVPRICFDKVSKIV